ncbi:peptide ligase PGM1-related protein [Pedococcus sp. 5OH_020]|uniref:peptide ligase PGM1-related protein n=1 Tax=Pedococcus sp. 5OH_020 TaxID=2989814 RepID=UPI0022EA094D|nr:peptide ligase PGM1-related protein [Pedococcus sp. 5OH_020]
MTVVGATGATGATTLADLDEAARYAVFDRLQERMPAVWRGIQTADPLESVVVVPSLTLDRVTAGSAAMTQAMEERFLFMLLLLRQPRLRMVYVTSVAINPAILEYYLSLLPGVIPGHARSRLHLVDVGDSRAGSLTAKLLARPRLLALMRSHIPDPLRCHLVPYNTTTLERDLAVELGIPMYAADPRLFPLGTKSGCRQVFSEADVRFPAGAEDLHSLADVVGALVELRGDHPAVRSAMVKLNEGVSGSGNAVVDLTGLPEPGSATEPGEVEQRVLSMQLESSQVTVGAFLDKLSERGGIIEERVVGQDIRSPSVQLRVTPLGELEILSTHDQVLGGPSGQSYLGARFPAEPAYASLITAEATRIGQVLARKGVMGRFAVDFVVVHDGPQASDGAGWTSYAIEVNLRKGGTTHPFLTLQFLTDGRYDADSGRFLTPSGEERHLVATDHLEDPLLHGLRVDDLFDLVARTGMHYDQSRGRGIVFHMISAITECGRVGMTAIAETADAAQAVYSAAERALHEEAEAALAAQPLQL